MKTIGLIGGMSWESTAHYYEVINKVVAKKLGGLHSAKIIMYSVDFQEIAELQKLAAWEKMANILAGIAKELQSAGADMVLICTNTMHKVADEVQAAIDIPLLHIADATADVILSEGIKKVGLLGTRYTMEEAFYKEKLEKRGLEVVIPDQVGRDLVHNVIFDELCKGEINNNSRQQYKQIIKQLAESDAEAVILGCTEIGMLLQQSDSEIKLFDTTEIHAKRAVELALQDV